MRFHATRLACVVIDYRHEIRKSGVRVRHWSPIVRKTDALTDSGLLFLSGLFLAAACGTSIHAKRDVSFQTTCVPLTPDVDSMRHGGIDESGQIAVEPIRLFHERCMT